MEASTPPLLTAPHLHRSLPHPPPAAGYIKERAFDRGLQANRLGRHRCRSFGCIILHHRNDDSGPFHGIHNIAFYCHRRQLPLPRVTAAASYAPRTPRPVRADRGAGINCIKREGDITKLLLLIVAILRIAAAEQGKFVLPYFLIPLTLPNLPDR